MVFISRKIKLDKVFFKLPIEEVFPISGRDVIAVAGRISCGEVHDKSEVLVVDPAGTVLRETRLLDLDWFDRGRCGKHVSAEAGMNVAMLFGLADKDYLKKGHCIVIQ